MKIVDAEKLTPLLESIKKAIYFEDAGATRNRILSCLSDIDSLATDNPWEAAARKLAEKLADAESVPIFGFQAKNEIKESRDDLIKYWIAWAKGETK